MIATCALWEMPISMVYTGHRVPFMALHVSIEQLPLTSLAVEHLKHPPLYSVSFVRMQDKKVVSDLTKANSLELTTLSVVTAAQLPCQLNWAANWPGVQMTESHSCSATIELCVFFFCLSEILSHVILWHQCSRSIVPLGRGGLTGLTCSPNTGGFAMYSSVYY